VYHEGKEYEMKMRIYKPGRVSADLRHALGMPDSMPPPWINNMQRYGPPPSYPNLKIPGVNCSIPERMMDTGRLQVDEKGFTIYADCFGLMRDISERVQQP
jgi:splicing factor 3B subunit 2